MIDDNLFVHDPRRAGLVKRYHAQPHLNSQTVAEHTWQLLRIMTTIWPDIPRNVLMYAIYHDIAEGCTGDLPYTTKLSSPEIKNHMDALEEEATKNMRRLWGTPVVPLPTEEEKKFIKACELVEFAEYSWNELRMGNVYIKAVLQRVLPRIRDTRLSDAYLNLRFHEYVKHRKDYEEKMS